MKDFELWTENELVKWIVNSFDKNKYQQVIDFANAANGNRNIITNEPIQFPSK